MRDERSVGVVTFLFFREQKVQDKEVTGGSVRAPLNKDWGRRRNDLARLIYKGMDRAERCMHTSSMITRTAHRLKRNLFRAACIFVECPVFLQGLHMRPGRGTS